ncbi:MAG: acetate kinase [Clostridia bacterium]|nr:acetate kinase [Clostridia bacterium]
MKILVLNCGSSSLKYQIIDMENEEVLAKGNYQRIGEDEAFLEHKVNGQKYTIQKSVYNHTEAISEVVNHLTHNEYGVIGSLNEIDAIGHRVVHGGEIFDKSVLITEEVIKQIEDCSDLAPLHNPAAILGIRACQNLMEGKPMVAVFDTAFHQTMPKENYLYPIPYEYYTKHKIRKYGMHGTSHKFVANRVAELVGKKVEELKIVTCHLGQGSSICAVNGGKSIDTSMGLSPLGGIPMVTRSGDLDPAVVTHIMEKENLTPGEVNSILNKKSGVAAISQEAPDFRTIESAYNTNENAKIAVDVFTNMIAQFVARYAVVLDGVDVLVFTGGIGENQKNVRKAVCEKLRFMGIEINLDKNDIMSDERKISTSNSKIDVWIVPTNEELVIARDTKNLI